LYSQESGSTNPAREVDSIEPSNNVERLFARILLLLYQGACRAVGRGVQLTDKAETGNSKFEIRKSKLETGSWKLEAGDLKFEI
jgi:hypothetical protein